jgi:hypothetical protein
MVRTYWLVPVFYEASGNLDLQPFRTIDHVEACRPRAMYATNGSPVAWSRGLSRRDCEYTSLDWI